MLDLQKIVLSIVKERYRYIHSDEYTLLSPERLAIYETINIDDVFISLEMNDYSIYFICLDISKELKVANVSLERARKFAKPRDIVQYFLALTPPSENQGNLKTLSFYVKVGSGVDLGVIFNKLISVSGIKRIKKSGRNLVRFNDLFIEFFVEGNSFQIDEFKSYITALAPIFYVEK